MNSKKYCIVIAFISGLICCGLKFSVAQSVVTGTWLVTFEANEGSTIQAMLLLEQQGNNIKGINKREGFPSDSLEGTIDGNFIRLLSRQKNERNGKMLYVIREGNVTEDSIKGVLSFEWEDGKQLGKSRKWSAERISKSVDPNLNNQKREIFKVSDLPETKLKVLFQKELDRIREYSNLPGAIAAFLLDDGRKAVVATGLADKEYNIPMTIKDRIPAGSIGKTFVAATTLNLVLDGQLNLDLLISTWLGDEIWFNQIPNANDITLRMLLNHSSGLTDYVNDSRFIAAVRKQTENLSDNPDFKYSPVELVAFTFDQDPLFQAGHGYSYSDINYILVGLIIEKVTGSKYYKELHERILSPLSLTQTSPANNRTLSGLVPGYMAPDNPLGLPEKTTENGIMIFNPATEWTGGGIISNPSDLVRWGKVLFEGKAMHKPYLKDLLNSSWKERKSGSQYSLGVSIDKDAFGMTYGHDGWFRGYRSKLVYLPKYKMSIAIQVNTDVQVDLEGYIARLLKVLLKDISNR